MAGREVESGFDDFDILKLIRSQNVGPRTFYALINFFGSASKALENAEELSLRGGRSRPIKLPSDDSLYAEIERVHHFGAKLISYKSASYSPLLRQIHDAPPILSYKGNIELMQKPCVAIVGARNASLNGCVMAKKLAKGLSANNYVVVSGLAKGIDSAAHTASVPNTIAVIAGGIDHIYPKENTKLYEQISRDGLLIAELPIGSAPSAQHFPQRNRIISGLSYGAVIVEANLKSGSLITARCALEQNREIFSVPGFPLDPRAMGTNKLIKEGAVLVSSIDDVLEALNSSTLTQVGLTEANCDDSNSLKAPRSMPDITDEMRQLVLNALSSAPVEIELLVQQTGISLLAMHVVILELELAGKAIRHPGNKISLLFEV